MQAKDRQLFEQQCGAHCIATDFQALTKKPTLPWFTYFVCFLIVEIYNISGG
jgi:hypothetical protein